MQGFGFRVRVSGLGFSEKADCGHPAAIFDCLCGRACLFSLAFNPKPATALGSRLQLRILRI